MAGDVIAGGGRASQALRHPVAARPGAEAPEAAGRATAADRGAAGRIRVLRLFSVHFSFNPEVEPCGIFRSVALPLVLGVVSGVILVVACGGMTASEAQTGGCTSRSAVAGTWAVTFTVGGTINWRRPSLGRERRRTDRSGGVHRL